MTVVEHRRPIGQQLSLPGADLVGVDVVFAGDLVDGLEAFDCLQGDGELELVAELSAFSDPLSDHTNFGMIADSTFARGGVHHAS